MNVNKGLVAAIGIATLMIIGVIVIFYTLLPSFGGRSEESLTTVVSLAKNNEIREIVVDGKKLTVYPRATSGVGVDRFTSKIGNDTNVINLLVESGVEVGSPSGVEVTFKSSSVSGSSFAEFTINWFSVIAAVSVGLGVLGTIFWVWMLVDCATKEPDEGNSKVVWILIIVFTHLVGAAIYFFVRRLQRVAEA